jgi:hypothetical protein
MYFGNTNNERNVVMALHQVVVQGDGYGNDRPRVHRGVVHIKSVFVVSWIVHMGLFVSLRIVHPW